MKLHSLVRSKGLTDKLNRRWRGNRRGRWTPWSCESQSCFIRTEWRFSCQERNLFHSGNRRYRTRDIPNSYWLSAFLNWQRKFWWILRGNLHHRRNRLNVLSSHCIYSWFGQSVNSLYRFQYRFIRHRHLDRSCRAKKQLAFF